MISCITKNKPQITVGFTGKEFIMLKVSQRYASRVNFYDFDDLIADYPLEMFDIKIVYYNLRIPDICPF